MRKLQPDAFWTSDDLGHQKQLFMRPETFRKLIKPYYLRMGEYIHGHDMHWWLHSCGNNTSIMDDLIEAGVDVFHPVQKGTMEYAEVAERFGDRMTFLVGFDVQHVLQEETPEDVRAEVRAIIDMFDREDGGLCIAAGQWHSARYAAGECGCVYRRIAALRHRASPTPLHRLADNTWAILSLSTKIQMHGPCP